MSRLSTNAAIRALLEHVLPHKKVYALRRNFGADHAVTTDRARGAVDDACA